MADHTPTRDTVVNRIHSLERHALVTPGGSGGGPGRSVVENWLVLLFFLPSDPVL